MALTERLLLLIEGNAAGAVTALTETSAATEELTLAQKAQKFAQNQLGVETLSTGTILKGAATAGGALAAVGIAKWALDGADKFASLTSEVRGYQRVTGASAEDSSKLAFAVREVGLDAEGAQRGFFQLAQRIGRGVDTLDQFGASVAKNKDGNIDMASTILNVAEAYQNIEDPALRAAFLMENFGRSGSQLAPLLLKSRQELKSFFDEAGKDHQIFSQDDLTRGREYGLALRQLDEAMTGVQVEVGQALIPTLTELATSLKETTQGIDQIGGAAKDMGLSGPIGDLNDFGKSLVNPVEMGHKLSDVLGFGSGEADKNSGATKKNADAHRKHADALSVDTTKLQEEATAAADATTAMLNLTTAVEAQFNSELRHEEAVSATAKALQDYQTAQDDANASNDPAKQQAATDAYNSLRDAVLGQAGAAAQQAKDQFDANTMLQGAEKQAGETSAANAAYRDELGRLRDTLAPDSPLRAYLDQLIGRLDAAAQPHVGSLWVNTAEGSAAVAALKAQIDEITSNPHEVEIFVRGALGGL